MQLGSGKPQREEPPLRRSQGSQQLAAPDDPRTRPLHLSIHRPCAPLLSLFDDGLGNEKERILDSQFRIAVRCNQTATGNVLLHVHPERLAIPRTEIRLCRIRRDKVACAAACA